MSQYRNQILQLLDSEFEANQLLGVQQAILELGWSYRELAAYVINSRKGWEYKIHEEIGFLADKVFCDYVIQFEVDAVVLFMPAYENTYTSKYKMYVQTNIATVASYGKWHELENYQYQRMLQSIGHVLAIKAGVQEIDKPQVAYLDFFTSPKDMQQAIYNKCHSMKKLQRLLTKAVPANRLYELIKILDKQITELKDKLNKDIRKHLPEQTYKV